jgi:hypothetical protein
MCPRSIARIFKIQIRISSAYSLLPKKTPTQGIKAHTPKKSMLPCRFDCAMNWTKLTMYYKAMIVETVEINKVVEENCSLDRKQLVEDSNIYNINVEM